ncbi:MAG: acyl-CoA desaturase [Bacteroidales bacterium]|jgi:linoleoyl-CoA desaturase|nr:acyl-CoA desaturase [Bacteroidales bacterium]
MSTPNLKYNKQDQPEFIKELQKKVKDYFTTNNISRHANLNMKLKTTFMLLLYFTPLALMLTGVVTTFWPMMLMWFIMSLGMSGIGLSVMHDANHKSYSKNPTVNNILGFLVNFLGANDLNWKIQHNYLHHGFTNIEGIDDDIKTPVMRFSPNQKRKKIFRFQLYYAPLLYGLMTLNWLVIKDFMSLIKYHKKNLLQRNGLTMNKAFTLLIFNKLWYLGLTLVLPLILIDLPWWQIVMGFLMMQYICGLILTLIFQPAHVIEETDFFIADESGSMENHFAIHQMKTTANFANKSVLFSWFIGGLNYQIEHHLFPNICHVHYRKISKIVKETAEDFNIPYNQHKTFFGALKSHFTLIHQLGTGKYDLKLTKVKV